MQQQQQQGDDSPIFSYMCDGVLYCKLKRRTDTDVSERMLSSIPPLEKSKSINKSHQRLFSCWSDSAGVDNNWGRERYFQLECSLSWLIVLWPGHNNCWLSRMKANHKAWRRMPAKEEVKESQATEEVEASASTVTVARSLDWLDSFDGVWGTIFICNDVRR